MGAKLDPGGCKIQTDRINAALNSLVTTVGNRNDGKSQAGTVIAEVEILSRFLHSGEEPPWLRASVGSRCVPTVPSESFTYYYT